ncbi:MAG: SDR family oxidoreductase [Burkholderiaceae bacterium]|nr:SDR family oxidoreductase [Burkholderiaceae bacterium]
MDLGIAGKQALITGSTGGIGYAIAEGLAREGARVWITGRSSESVQRALVRLAQAVPGCQAGGTAADCATPEGAHAVFDELPQADILVNNLGVYGRAAAFEITDAQWQSMFDTNVMSGVRFTRHYTPAMAQRGWGRVIFVSSESALNIPREMIHYGMTKAAQLAISRGFAIEMAGTGVTVNALLPGPTNTENTARLRAERARAAGVSLAELEAEFFSKFRPSSLLARFTSADEVASAAVYLCSERASATTGAAMRVDGGTVNQIM